MNDKIQIIIPSYIGHLNEINHFFESLVTNCLDKEDININIIVSESELDIFHRTISKHSISYKLVSLREIIKKEIGKDINEEILLGNLNKFNFQLIKKIYAAKYLGYKNALIMDSESSLIRKAKISEIINNVGGKIYFSPYCGKIIQTKINKICFNILRIPIEDIWLCDYQNWFFEIELIIGLLEYIQKINGLSLYEIINNIGNKEIVFEPIIYNLYIKNILLKESLFINSEEIIKKYLKEKYEDFKYTLSVGYGLTGMELLAYGITKSNIDDLTEMYIKENLPLFKPDVSFGQPKDIQIQFIKQTKSIKMLCCKHDKFNFYLGDFFIK